MARFKVEPDYWGGLYYWSSLQHFQQAIEKAGTLDQKKIRDIMAKEKFDTALGPFWYDENRYFVNHRPGCEADRAASVPQARVAEEVEVNRERGCKK